MRVILSALLASAAACATPAFAETIILHAGRVITDASQPTTGPATITVTDGKITAITPGYVEAPAGAKLVNLRDKTVLPGLIDMHVHLQSNPGGDYRDEAVVSDDFATLMGARNALRTVKAGFTTVRDLGSTPQGGFALREATAQGLIPGPRIISSGPAVSIIGGHGDVNGFRPEVAHALDANNTCTGPVECAARVREFSKAGADVIKITATGGVLSQQGRGLGQHFTDPELKAIVDTAHSLGLRVAAHAHSARGVEAAARARTPVRARHAAAHRALRDRDCGVLAGRLLRRATRRRRCRPHARVHHARLLPARACARRSLRTPLAVRQGNARQHAAAARRARIRRAAAARRLHADRQSTAAHQAARPERVRTRVRSRVRRRPRRRGREGSRAPQRGARRRRNQFHHVSLTTCNTPALTRRHTRTNSPVIGTTPSGLPSSRSRSSSA